uniref:Putative secreted protein n=1 Tax=Amblyomma parvum TaxID=251391 RepID=A0A023G327_AMBPA
MRRTALLALMLAVSAATYVHVPCGRYPTKITSLDNATCIPEYFSGIADGGNITRHPGNCTPTVSAYTSCTCDDGNGVSGYNYCVYNVSRTPDDNTANVTIGLCGIGPKCYTYDFNASMEVDLRDPHIARSLKIFPRSPCVVPDLEVASGIKAAAGCEHYCYGRRNKDIRDERVCVLEWYTGVLSGEPIVTLTGSCSNGICRISGVYEYPVKGTCHDSERYKHYGKLLEKCTYRCPNGSTALRPDGLRCRFSKTWYKRDIVGVCQNGVCSEIREEKPCAMGSHYHRNKAPVKVAEACVCKHKALENGTLCALTYKFGLGGYLLREVGICVGGQCKHRPPDRPAEYKFKKKECKALDVQVTSELIVAAACSATCRRYEIEARPNGTLCLLQYRRDTYNVVQKKETLHIGECWNGKCKYSDNSFDMRI